MAARSIGPSWVITGTVEVDSETGEVFHFDHKAEQIPPALDLTSAATSVDLAPVDAGGSTYLLPVKSQTELDGPKGSRKNETEFRNYAKFDANSTIDYGVGK